VPILLPETGLSNFRPCIRFFSDDLDFDPVVSTLANETVAPIPKGQFFI